MVSVKQTNHKDMERMREQMKKKTNEWQAEPRGDRVFCDRPSNNRLFILWGVLLLIFAPSLLLPGSCVPSPPCCVMSIRPWPPTREIETRIFRIFEENCLQKDADRLLTSKKGPYHTKDILRQLVDHLHLTLLDLINDTDRARQINQSG